MDKDSAVMHVENELNIPLFRDHQELIRYHSKWDDAYRYVVETMRVKISPLIDPQKKVEGM